MRKTPRLVLAFLLLTLPVVAAVNWNSLPPIDYSKMKKSSLPDFVRVRVEVVVKVYEDGKEAGTVGLKRGVKLKVVDIDANGILEVRFAGAKCYVDHVATDFVERLK